MLEQKNQVDKINLEKVKSEILSAVKELNMGQGMSHESTNTNVARFYSTVGWETEDGDKRGVIEVDLNVRLLAPHFDSHDYDEAISKLEGGK